MLSKVDFSPYFYSPEELASQVLQVYFDGDERVFPVDPFKLLKDFGIAFQMRNFDKLEGIYIVPEDDSDIPVVGINNNRPITRQRYTAAHEICHHVKDKTNVYCPINRTKNQVEIFADEFAACLLMPMDALTARSELYMVDGFVEFDNVLRIADFFGVSFETCVYRLAYRLNRISGDIDPKVLKKRIRSYRPNEKRISVGLENHDRTLLGNVIESYVFFLPQESTIVWLRFKNDFIYNENRLEGLEIDYTQVAEIVTDLRMNKQGSPFCTSDNQAIIEVCGHSSIYDYISSTGDPVSAFGLLRLHQRLLQYTPYPKAGGSFRQANNLVMNAAFETSDYHDVIDQIAELDREVKKLVQDIDKITLTEYIDSAVRIHHRLTVIHPFPDGNGRISRAFLNWMFRIRGLPPVYLKYESKQKYLEALAKADQSEDYEPLTEIFYREILRSMFTLNSKFQ